jgi:hypothetical protein
MAFEFSTTKAIYQAPHINIFRLTQTFNIDFQNFNSLDWVGYEEKRSFQVIWRE